MNALDRLLAGVRTYTLYARYVLRHKLFVFIECCRLGVIWRGVVHDLSKFRPSELIPYARYFYGTKCSTESEREYRQLAFDKAWLMHQHRNPHHHQYWVLREDDGPLKLLPMPDSYRREMLADWRGAGMALGFGRRIGQWYLKNRHRMHLHPETRLWIEMMIEKTERVFL